MYTTLQFSWWQPINRQECLKGVPGPLHKHNREGAGKVECVSNPFPRYKKCVSFGLYVDLSCPEQKSFGDRHRFTTLQRLETEFCSCISLPLFVIHFCLFVHSLLLSVSTYSKGRLLNTCLESDGYRK